jgi:hypothetical protein
MNEMTDIELILADAPRDIELYSVICGVVKLAGRGKNEETNEIMRIKTYTEDDGIFHWFNRYGQRSTRGECVLFPSREHRTWDDWQSVLFRAGDIIAIDASDNPNTKKVAIYVYAGDGYAYNALGIRITVELGRMRYATESEAEFFNGTLYGNGYIWDEHTEALVALDDLTRPIAEKMRAESGKFSLSDLQPFDKVLVRNSRYPARHWRLGFFESVSADGMVCTVGNEYMYSQCVPYNEETRYLLGTSKDYIGKYGKCE